MMLRKVITLLFLICWLASPLVSAATTQYTGLMFENTNSVASSVTAVDTDETGLLFTAGYANGSIAGFDNTGAVVWKVNTNASIKKLLSDYEGNIVFLNGRNETGYISKTGVSRSLIQTTDNVSDIGITRDGSFFATSSWSPPKLSVYTKYGNLSGYNSTINTNWTGFALDPDGAWLVSANQSDNKVYLWNLTAYRGWEEFNPTRTYNSTLKFIDSFQYRRNLSVVSYTNHTNIRFKLNTTNTTDILKINESWYEYNNLTTGNFFYISTPGNYTDRTSEYVNYTFRDDNSGLINIVFKPNWKNFTMYYGNTSYNGTYSASTSGTQSFTSGSTFTVPPFITSVSYQIQGGGANGGIDVNGGGAGQYLTGSVATTPGTGMGVGVGGAGSSSSFGGQTAVNGTPAGSGSLAGSNGNLAGISAGRGYPSYQYWSSEGGSTGCDYGDILYQSGWGEGGSGYGAGGGSGTTGYICGGAAGGAGAQGKVILSWTAAAIDYGKMPTKTIFPVTRQESQTNSFLTYVEYQSFANPIQKITTTEGGGWLGISDTEYLYMASVSKTGFGDSGAVSTDTFTDITNDLKMANGAAYIVDARASRFTIVDSLGETVGAYTAGGSVNSVDIGMKNGLWSVMGGDDGKLYVASKDLTSTWYIYYQGDSGAPINSVAMTWRGEIECLGRTDGNFECYDNRLTKGSSMDFEVFVYNNGAPYQTTVSVRESDTYPYSWHAFTTPIVATDSNGKGLVQEANVGRYYELTVGTKVVYYTADEMTYQVVISVDTTPVVVGGYNYTATSTNTSYPGNLTITYTDSIVPTSVIIKVAEKDTGKIIYNNQINYNANIKVIVPANPTTTYEVQWVWDRDGVRGMAGKTLFVPTGGGFNFGNVDQNVKYALFYIVFLFVCGLFTYATRTIGAFISAIFYVFLVVMQILPFTLLNIAGIITILTITAVFGEAKERR